MFVGFARFEGKIQAIGRQKNGRTREQLHQLGEPRLCRPKRTNEHPRGSIRVDLGKGPHYNTERGESVKSIVFPIHSESINEFFIWVRFPRAITIQFIVQARGKKVYFERP